MKQCHLRNPLVSSTVMLAALVILIGLMLSSGGFFAGIWAFIVMIFRTIQLSIALTIGIIVCLAFLIALFLAAVAVHEGKASAIKKFEALQVKLLGWVDQARDLCPCIRGKKVTDELEKSPIASGVAELVDDMQEEVSGAIESIGPDVVAVREEFEKKMEDLNKQLQVVKGSTISPEDIKAVTSEMIGATDATVVSVREELANKIEDLDSQVKTVQSSSVTAEHVKETVASEVSSIREAVGAADAGLKELHAKVDVVADKVASVSPDDIIGDIPSRLESLENREMPAPVDLQPLQEQIAALRSEVAVLDATKGQVAALKDEVAVLKEALAEVRIVAETPRKKEKVKPVPEKSQGKSEQGDEHRLLSYYANTEDKQKFSDLVIQTLKKDMTYAQVMDFLIEEMGEEGGKVVSEHPSLAKDYIRQCRRNA